MLSKEKFLEYLKIYRDLDRKEAKLNEALEEYCGEPTMIYSGGLGLALDILCEVMNDQDFLIVSFIYDSNYGEAENPNYLIEGENVAITSPEILYDVLTKNG